MRFLARPLVLPRGVWEVGLGLNIDKSFAEVGAAIAANYGLIDKLSMGASYGFSFKPSEFNGPLLVHTDYSLVDSGQTQIVARLRFGYDAAASGLAPLVIATDLRHKLDDKKALLIAARFVASLEKVESLDDMMNTIEIQPVFIEAPIGFAYQVDEQVYAEITSQLLRLNVSDDKSGIIIADLLPLRVAGLYSLDNKIDIGGALGIDLNPREADTGVGDTFFVGLLARYRGGF
jgi:hypothetical protein